MELAFPWPFSQGEWLAWISAAVTVLFGLAAFFAPRLTLRLLGRQPERAGAAGEPRATIAGFYLGLGLCAILLAQPLIYLALGASWAMTAFGRLIALLSDRGNAAYGWIAFLVAIVLAALPLLFVLGIVA